MPKISIIVPIHNMQDYLRESLDSAVGQTLKDIEVICIDDSSGDMSAEILREYAKRDPRVRVITYEENKTASQARKDGALAADGEYLMFLDADDTLDLDACERLYASVRDAPVDILHFGMVIANEGNLPQSTVDWLEEFVTPYDGVLEGSEILEACFSENRLYGFSLTAKLFSADLCKKAFLRVRDGKFPIGEDKYAYFVLSYYAQTYRGMKDAALYHYCLGRGVTGHDAISLSQFEKFCSMGLVADAIRGFLVEESALQQHGASYLHARKELLMDCVANWSTRLSADDKLAGFALMQKYWEASEVLARIAEVVVPSISIIIPVHDMQDYLRESLDSAVGQTKPDIEVICVDTHSADASADIIREYVERDPRVRVITFPENRSISQARKDGVLVANGEYIMFLDADDALVPDACERLYAAVRDNPVDILHFGTLITNEKKLPQDRMDWLRAFVSPFDGELLGSEILEGCFSEKLYNFSLWDKLYSADLCKRAFSRIRDGRFPLGADKYAYFVLSFFARTYRGVPDEVLCHHHFGRGVTGHNLLSLPEFERVCAMALVANAIRDFLVEEGVLARYERPYRNARSELLQDCVDNWNGPLGANDRGAGLQLMLAYWDESEVRAKIAGVASAKIAEVARPKISIIIPVYNMESYLHQCLDTAVGQTLEDIEVICVDDRSDDGSAAILSEYARRDPRVRVITFLENRGESQARKEGVSAATGEYFMFLDADDGLELHACEKLSEEMSRAPVDILHFGTIFTNESTLPARRIEWLRRFLQPHDGVLEDDDIFERAFGADRLYNFTIWDKLYSADLCKRSFACIKDGRFPRAADKYAYFILSYYARTYRGLPDERLYHYYFGRGVTGHNLVSLRQFEGVCSMGLVADAMKEFLVGEGTADRFEWPYANARDELLEDCTATWGEHLAAEDRAAGYGIMFAYWDPPEVIAKIAKLNWAQQGHIARVLKGSASVAYRPRRVRTVGTYYHRVGNGGAERVLSILIKLWQELGYKVVLFTDDPPSSDDYDLPDGVQWVVLPSFFEIEPGTYLDRARALELAIKEHAIDVMVYHAWVSPILLWDLMLCKAAGVAFVTHCHSVFSYLARSNAPYFADMPFVYHLCDAIVALSEADRAYWGNFNSNVVPMFNPLTFDLDGLELSPLQGRNVLWIGRLSGEKRPQDALRIFAKVLEAQPDAKLLMVGSCSEQAFMENLHELIDELGIRDSVEMVGFQKDVLPFYRAASVLLMTSEFEGFSLALSEGQSLGVPCVMYDLPYLTLTRPRKGFIAVEMGDLNAAADAVVEVLRDPEYRITLGRAARANVEELAQFDFGGAWRRTFDDLSQKPVERPVDETTRIMWETLLDHYRTGTAVCDFEIRRRDKELGKRWELLQEATRLRGERYKQLQQRNSELSAARGDLKNSQLEINKLKEDLAISRKAQKKLRASRSFKIGYMITSIPRTLRKSLRGSGSSKD